MFELGIQSTGFCNVDFYDLYWSEDNKLQGAILRVTIAYNLRTDDTEASAELLTIEDVKRIEDAIKSLKHVVST